MKYITRLEQFGNTSNISCLTQLRNNCQNKFVELCLNNISESNLYNVQRQFKIKLQIVCLNYKLPFYVVSINFVNSNFN